MDVNIVQHDGREICKLLKSDTLIRAIPVTLFSAMYNLQETHRECEATDFIAKPFEVNDLVLKVHSILSKEAHLA